MCERVTGTSPAEELAGVPKEIFNAPGVAGPPLCRKGVLYSVAGAAVDTIKE